MKRILNIAAFTVILVLAASLRNAATAQDDDYYGDDNYYENDNRGEVSYQTFYDELSPHGRWIDNPEYGYVWVPNAGRDFRPYSTNGHWVWTNNYEWMWVSDYSWGWAPFHYGRWFYDPFYGWVWVPGYQWSPAWVAWRSGGDYYGWAPIRPGISISINIGFGNYNPPYDYWCFAPRRYITSPRIYDYYYDRRQNITIINQTTIINNYNYSGNVWRTGPSRYEAERYAGRITPVRFRESSRPGRTQFRNNEVSVYRPRVTQDNTRRFSPRNVERYERTSSNDDRVSRNQTRDQQNGRRFERNTDGQRSNDVSTRGNGNNLPRRERSTGAPVERRNDGMRQPQERRNIERPSEQRREMRTMDRPQQMERRNVERPSEQRREMRTMDRPQQMERRNVERPSEQRREMRTMDRPQQMERSAPSQTQPQQQQRQFERRSDDNGNRGGGGNGNGNGKGRKF